MPMHKRIATVGDIKLAALITHEDDTGAISSTVLNAFHSECKLLHVSNDSIESLIVTPPDVLFISCTDANRKKKFDLCQRLRESGYDGIIILFVDDISEFGDTASITSSGFDNYLLKTDCDSRHLDNIDWGILNCRRRN